MESLTFLQSSIIFMLFRSPFYSATLNKCFKEIQNKSCPNQHLLPPQKNAQLNFTNISATEDRKILNKAYDIEEDHHKIFGKDLFTYASKQTKNVHERLSKVRTCIYASCVHFQHYIANISATEARIFTKFET